MAQGERFRLGARWGGGSVWRKLNLVFTHRKTVECLDIDGAMHRERGGASRLRAVVDRTFPLAEAAEAQRAMAANRNLGKIVLIPAGDRDAT